MSTTPTFAEIAESTLDSLLESIPDASSAVVQRASTGEIIVWTETRIFHIVGSAISVRNFASQPEPFNPAAPAPVAPAAPADYAQAFADALNEKFPLVKSYDETYGVTRGQKFDRVTHGRSVHAFVEKATGALVKAASWKAPARKVDGSLQSKFNLSTPEGFAEAVAAADPYTSYLYVR